MAQFSGCSVCPIGNHKLPPSVPKDLQPQRLFAFLKQTDKSVRDLWGESIRMPSEGEDGGVSDQSPQSCGRSDMKHLVTIPADARITHRSSVHFGPSEVYVDNQLVWQVEDFQKAPLMPASVFDCDKPACEVRWYWMNVERMTYKGYFQLYVNCFSVKGNAKPIRAISGGESGGKDTGGDSDGGMTPPPSRPTPALTSSAPTSAPSRPMTPAPGSKRPSCRPRRAERVY